MESKSENHEEQQQLQTAMKAIGQAIQLDVSGSVPDAYVHYLSCMQYISQCLLQDARVKVSQSASVQLKTKTSIRMVKLAQQCSERVADIMNNMEDTSTLTSTPFLNAHQTTNLSPSPTPPSSSMSSSMSSSVQAGRISPSMFPAVPSSLSHAAPTHVAVVRPTVQHPGQQSIPGPNASPLQQSNEALGPLEKAYRENRKLMAAYKSRLNKMQTTSKNKSIVNLTFQRRLMENMAIAKAREASLAKKLKERQLRLQEQAAQRFSSSGQPTKEEMELRTVYASILEYENIKTWLQEWRRRLQESPSDLELIHNLVTDILSCDQHPLTQLLKRYQITIYQKIMPLIQKEMSSIEEIVVPYGGVEPIKLQEPRAVPEGGFTTPDELDQSVEETLAQRLLALRENSTSSVESDSTDTSQAKPAFSRPGEVNDDILEEILSEEEEDGRASLGCHATHGGITLSRTFGMEDADGDEKCEENGHLDDSGIQNGEEASSSDEALPFKNALDYEDAGTTGGIQDDDNDTSQKRNRMREIREEIRDDIQQALQDGEKLLRELEGRNDETPVEENDIDDNVTKATSDSTKNEDSDSAKVLRTITDSEDAQGNITDTNRHYVDDHPLSMKDERTKANFPDERSSGDIDGLEQANKGQDPSDMDTSTKRDESSTDELGDTDNQPGEKEDARKEQGIKMEDDGEDRIAEMRVQALSRHLKSITKDVIMFTERLQSLLVAVYEQLNSTSVKEHCISVIEAFFFKDICQPLLMLFRRFNYKKEKYAAIAMTKYQHALPQHIGVHEKFWLFREEGIEDGGQTASGDYPYRLAVEELQKLQNYTCPVQKIECIVKVSRMAIECVGDFYESQGKPRQSPEHTVGCDDLLPILSYVIIKSALPQIVSECNAMEEFIHEGYLFGEEGYCLTTCQTALSYVLKLGSD